MFQLPACFTPLCFSVFSLCLGTVLLNSPIGALSVDRYCLNIHAYCWVPHVPVLALSFKGLQGWGGLQRLKLHCDPSLFVQGISPTSSAQFRDLVYWHCKGHNIFSLYLSLLFALCPSSSPRICLCQHSSPPWTLFILASCFFFFFFIRVMKRRGETDE